MTNSLLNISAIVFGVFFIAFLVSIVYIIRDNYRGQKSKKKDDSVDLWLFNQPQDSLLLTPDSYGNYPLVRDVMKYTTSLSSNEPTPQIASTTEVTTTTTKEYLVEI